MLNFRIILLKPRSNYLLDDCNLIKSTQNSNLYGKPVNKQGIIKKCPYELGQ